MRVLLAALAAAAAATVAPACKPGAGSVAPPEPDAPLDLARDGVTFATRTARELAAAGTATTVDGFDPYYGRAKRFVGVPLAPVLAAAYPDVDLASAHFVLRATDGYAVPLEGRTLVDGAVLAWADADVPGWEPIGPRRQSPAPYYLVWSKPGQTELGAHPRPWQLRAVDLVPLERAWPHVVPAGLAPEHPAWRGLALFRAECIRCHAINREGGRVGPDLNVPRSIVDYRPEAQIRAYVRDPSAFRYGAMPAHPGLDDAALDALVAYFRAMSERKHDADAKDGGPP